MEQITYPLRFFPQGMPVETLGTKSTYYVESSVISTDTGKSFLILQDGRIQYKHKMGLELNSVVPKPDGILGFTPAMYAALVDGRKTQITVPIRKKLFKAGDIVRVGERFGYFDFEKNRIIYWSDGTQCDLIDNNIKTYRGDDFPPSWRLNGRCNWHNFPNNLPLWATRHFIRITGVETKAPSEFETNECLHEGIRGVLNMSYENHNPNRFNVGKTDGVKFFFDDQTNYKTEEEAWKDLWLSLHPKDGETTFEQQHTVYQFELCK